MKTSRLPYRHPASRYAQPAGKTRSGQSQARTQLPEPKLVYQQRGTAAGIFAWLETYEIRLNPVLLMENVDAFINEVVPHELAHLLVWKYFGRVPPRQRVEMDDGKRAGRSSPTYASVRTAIRCSVRLYRCKCQEHQLTVRRHNRVDTRRSHLPLRSLRRTTDCRIIFRIIRNFSDLTDCIQE